MGEGAGVEGIAQVRIESVVIVVVQSRRGYIGPTMRDGGVGQSGD